MIDNGIQCYKEAKKLNGQIEYLNKNKRVQFDDIGINDAEDILLQYNYINVITPFKHHLALQNDV